MEEAQSLSSTFPNPPPFWKEFTPDKVARIAELRAAYGDDEAFRVPGLPEELGNLQPPTEPKDGRWRVFGDQYMLDDKLPTLEEQGITNLPGTTADSKDSTHHDRAFELKKLTKSLLVNFLELNGILSRSPSAAEAKMGDLRTLFINIHHVLNEYRPHQARESAIATMQEHLDKTRAETKAIREQVAKAKMVLADLKDIKVPLAPEEQKVEVNKDTSTREQSLWEAVDNEFK